VDRWPNVFISGSLRRAGERLSSGTEAQNLNGLQAVQGREHLRDEDHEIVKASAAAVEDDDGNAPTAQAEYRKYRNPVT
jgi:hypothetical protein